MKSRSLLVCLLLAVPALAPGASKEIKELQRDVALLQQQIKDLQRSQDEKFAAVTGARPPVHRSRQPRQYQRGRHHKHDRKEPARPDRQGGHPGGGPLDARQRNGRRPAHAKPGGRRPDRPAEPHAGPVDRHQQRHQSDSAAPGRASGPTRPGRRGVLFGRAPDVGGDHVQCGAPGLRGRQVRSGFPGVRRLSEVLRQHELRSQRAVLYRDDSLRAGQLRNRGQGIRHGAGKVPG